MTETTNYVNQLQKSLKSKNVFIEELKRKNEVICSENSEISKTVALLRKI